MMCRCTVPPSSAADSMIGHIDCPEHGGVSVTPNPTPDQLREKIALACSYHLGKGDWSWQSLADAAMDVVAPVLEAQRQEIQAATEVLDRVREALRQPEDSALSMHAARVMAELDEAVAEVSRLRAQIDTANLQVDRSIRRMQEFGIRNPPHIVCICGSMRFYFNMLEASIDESLAGRIVVLPLVNMKRPDARWATEEQAERIKTELDRLHFAKIDLADEVLVVNPGGYIGDSTRREIAYAEQHGKPVRYLDTASSLRGSVPATPPDGCPWERCPHCEVLNTHREDCPASSETTETKDQ